MNLFDLAVQDRYAKEHGYRDWKELEEYYIEYGSGHVSDEVKKAVAVSRFLLLEKIKEIGNKAILETKSAASLKYLLELRCFLQDSTNQEVCDASKSNALQGGEVKE